VPLRQASEQNFTCSQSRSHFLRQLNERPQTGQIFDGISDFFTSMTSSGLCLGGAGDVR
jgi:hypothetical protein